MPYDGTPAKVSRRRFLQTTGVGAVALATGVASADGLLRASRAAAQAGADTLLVAQSLSVQTFDPHIVYDNTLLITRGFYEGLVGLKGDTAQLVPRLATSWQGAPDARAWTFKLRPGVKFHDGTPFTSEAPKLAMERLLKINRGMAYAFNGDVARVDAPDPMTVKFTLTGPDAAFPAKLAAVAGCVMVSPAALKAHAQGDDLAQGWLRDHEAGTGPFVLDSFDKGAGRVTLSAFPEYWGGWSGQHVKRIIFTIAPEASTARLMLEKGDADVLTVVAPDAIEALSRESGIKILRFPTMRIFYIAMNTQREPLKDVKIRQALSYAFDYQSAKDLIFNGRLLPLYGPLPNNDPAHLSVSDKPYHLNLQKARQLLSESSRPNGGFTLSLFLFQGDPVFRKGAEILQAQLKPLNISVNIQEFASSVVLQKAGKLDTAPDLLPVRNYPDYADSSAMILATFGKDAWGAAGWNFSYYANDKVEALMKQANETTDQAKRLALFREAQQQIVADAPAVFIGTLVQQIAVRSNVQGYLYNPLLANTFDPYLIYKT